MSQRNLRPDLDIYSADTRKMLSGWVMTAAQADNQTKALKQCQPLGFSSPTMGNSGYPLSNQGSAMQSLVHVARKWRLAAGPHDDAGSHPIWSKQRLHFAKGVEHPYQFAFRDWSSTATAFLCAPARSNSGTRPHLRATSHLAVNDFVPRRWKAPFTPIPSDQICTGWGNSGAD